MQGGEIMIKRDIFVAQGNEPIPVLNACADHTCCSWVHYGLV